MRIANPRFWGMCVPNTTAWMKCIWHVYLHLCILLIADSYALFVWLM